MKKDSQWKCHDCGTQDFDLFMVRNEVWMQAWPTYVEEMKAILSKKKRHGFLCKPCMEKRLGRKLASRDYEVDSDSWIDPAGNDDLGPRHAYEFFNPHPGLAGCEAPLPEGVRLAAKRMDGQSLTVLEAMTAIRDAAPAGATIRKNEDGIGEWYGMILLEIEVGSKTHAWRVICYR